MAAVGKFGGRPKREPKPGERVHIGFRVTPDLKKRVENAAASVGRSVSQEAELRLERSFEREDLLGDALKLAFGERFAGLALLLCKAMHFAGAKASGLGAFTQGRYYPAADWMDDAFGYDQAVKAAHAILEAARPSGDPAPPIWDEHDPNLTDELRRKHAEHNMLLHHLGEVSADFWLALVRNNEGSDAEAIQRLLGPIVDRLSVKSVEEQDNG